MDKPGKMTLEDMKELVRWLNERIIDQEIATAVEKANHEEEEQNSETK